MNTIILGGGAAGLTCAIRLKQLLPQSEVTVLERLDAPGRKLLATGNGRCNLSNRMAPHSDEVVAFFATLGLLVREEEDGRLYPYSNRADTVLDVLLTACKTYGVQIVTGFTASALSPALTVSDGKTTYTAEHIVLACGGMAQQNLGANGSGYPLLRSLGHTITPCVPALVQLTSASKYPRLLKGQRVKCRLQILLDGETVGAESGEVLFTDYGLSGIVTMNLSSLVSENFAAQSPKKCIAALDLIPELTEAAVLEHRLRFGTLAGILGRRLAEIIEKQAQADAQKAAHIAKNWQLILTGTKGFAFAQITKGGAALDEFDGFASKKCPGVYACGEVLDRQFPCGGFNLNFAFYSGIAVAEQIAAACKTQDNE